MDVRQLRTVMHVAELGSLCKAAERLHIAQPSLSRQVRLLEQELGITLFERHGRRIGPTDAAAFRTPHPDAILRFANAYSGHLLDWLQRGDIDIAILSQGRRSRLSR